MSTRPGIKNLPRPSMVWAPGGAGVVAAGPAAVSRSPSTTTVASCIGGRPVPSIRTAPCTARAVEVAITTSPIFACSSQAISCSYQQTYPRECITSRSDDGDRRAGDDPGPFPDTCRGLDPGKADEKLTAAARANAERLHPAAVELYEPPDEAQVQAEARRGAVEPALALGEQIEAARQHFGGNPDTAVLDADDGLGVLALHAHSDRAAGRGEANRVRDQVGDDLVEPLRVGAHPHRVRLDVDRVTSELAGTGQDAHGLADAHPEVHRATRQHDVAAGNAREVEQVADQPPEVGDLVADRAARAVRDRVVTADAIEHAHRADDDRERVAQLVAQHRQELVLRPVGALR